MKILHTADLHIGKSVKGFSMLEDQRHIFGQLLNHIDRETPDALVIAGDVFDRPSPSAEAVRLYDWLMFELYQRELPVLMVAGNHDSPERLGVTGRILQDRGIHIAGVFDGAAQIVRLPGHPVTFHLMPFIRPLSVRPHFPEESIDSYQRAVELALQNSAAETEGPKVLVAHQFVVSGGVPPEGDGSEALQVGGLDAIDAALFGGFDYVALGHIHRAQSMGRPSVRYAGSPLKYSFSEKNQDKTATLVRLEDAGAPELTPLPLKPLRDMRELRGSFKEVMMAKDGQNPEDYLRVRLTDEQEIPDVASKIRTRYPNLMELGYDNTRSKNARAELAAPLPDGKTELELFLEFYALQNGAPPDEAQMAMLRAALDGTGETP